MPKRIRINLNCVADRYASQDYERIIEFIDPVTKLGGLVSFFRHPDNTLTVQVYRADNGVVIAGPRAMLAPPKDVPNPEHWRELGYAAKNCPGVIETHHAIKGSQFWASVVVPCAGIGEAIEWLKYQGWKIRRVARQPGTHDREIVIR